MAFKRISGSREPVKNILKNLWVPGVYTRVEENIMLNAMRQILILKYKYLQLW